MQYSSTNGDSSNNEVIAGHYLPLTARTAARDAIPDRKLFSQEWDSQCQHQTCPIWNMLTPSKLPYGLVSASFQGAVRQGKVLESVQWCMEMCKSDSIWDAVRDPKTKVMPKMGKGFNNFWTRAQIIAAEDIALANPCLIITAAQSLHYSFNSYLEGETAAVNMTIMLTRSVKSRAIDYACICRIGVPEAESTRKSGIFDNVLYYAKLGECLMAGNHPLAVGYAEAFIVQSLHDKDNKYPDPLPTAEFEKLSAGLFVGGQKIKHYANRRQLIWTALLAVLNYLKGQGRNYPCVVQIVEACYELAHHNKFRWEVESRLFGRMAILAVCLRDQVEARGLAFNASPIQEMPNGRDFTQPEILNMQYRHRYGNLWLGVSDAFRDKHSLEGKRLGRDIQHFIEVKAFLRHEDPTLMALSDYYLRLCMLTRYTDYNTPNAIFDKSGMSASQYAEWIPELRLRNNKLNALEDSLLKQTITITFCERAENHKGMQMLSNQPDGGMAPEGFTVEELAQICYNFRGIGVTCEFYNLNEGLLGALDANGEQIVGEPAAILILRNAASRFISYSSRGPNFISNPAISKLSNGLERVDDLYTELLNLEWDTKALMKGKVCNKKARHNLCFADFNQEPDYAAGKGRVVSFANLPHLSSCRQSLGQSFGPKAANLFAEGNHYYDLKDCYISFHGDFERRIVVAFRFGASMTLEYQWFQRSQPTGRQMIFQINHGDVYIMSEKATGNDWLKKIIPTLRHAANSTGK